MRIAAATVLMLILSVGAFASEAELTWEACLGEATRQNPELVSARAKLDAAKANKGIARSTALPQVSASAASETAKTEGRSKTKSSSYALSGRQLLFDGFKTSNDLAVAGENLKSASFNYEVTASNVRLELRTAFVGLLSAQETLRVTKNIVERRKRNAELVGLQYQSGQEHKGSLLTAQANAAQAVYEWEAAQRNLELYQRKLVQALGRTVFSPVVVSGELDADPADQSKPEFETLVDTVPLLKQLAAEKEAARLGVKSARSDFFPQVYADAGTGKTGDAWPPQTRNWSAGLSVSVPLFEGGQKQAALEKAKASLRQAEADQQSGRSSVIQTLVETWTAWQNAVDFVGVKEKFLEASKQRAEIVEAQYKTGLATFNDWTIIEDTLVDNQKALVQSKASALTAEASWLQAKGVMLDE